MLGPQIRQKLEDFDYKVREGLSVDSQEGYWSHADFRLLDLLEDGTRVGLWHWYVPALTKWLLSYFKDKKVSDLKRLKLWDGRSDPFSSLADESGPLHDLRDDMQRLGKELLSNEDFRKRLWICEDMSEMRVALNGNNFNAGVLLGIGSTVLKTTDNDIVRIRPREGITMWINCAAALHPKQSRHSRGRADSLDLIQYWLRDDVQMRMLQLQLDTDYFGLPVNQNVLRNAMEDPKFKSHPAFLTLSELLEPNGLSFRANAVAPRVLPLQLWTRWVDWWQGIVTAAQT